VVVEGGEQGVEVALANEVVLDALPGGDAQGAAGHRVAQRVHGKVLLWGQDPAGDAHPHHADVIDVEPLALSLGAHVAVVLLVDAVEPE
jgi:hypothetical protein